MQKRPVVEKKDIKQNQEFKYPLCWIWMIKAKSLVIKEICYRLPTGLDGWKVCSQEHISLFFIPDCLRGILPVPFLLSYSAFVFSFPLFFRFCAVR